MSAALTGTPVAWTSGNVTIPSDATAVYVLWTMWYGGTGYGLASATLASRSPNQTYEVAPGDSQSVAIGVAAWYSPPTGSQTLSMTWDQTPTEGPNVLVAFVKGGHLSSWRAADAGATDSSGGAIDATVTSRSTDLVLGLREDYAVSAPAAPTGWTSQQTQANNSEASRLMTCDSPGASSTVLAVSGDDYAAVLAVSIPSVDYFGACDNTGVWSGSATNSDEGFIFWRAYTCPGVGTKNITLFQLSGYGVGSAINAKLALYNSAGTTKLWESTGFSVETGSDLEYASASLSGIPQITGGTDYNLVWCASISGAALGSAKVDGTRSAGSYYDFGTHSLDYYTNGLPSSLPTPDGSFSMYPMRIGVEDDVIWTPQQDAPEKIIQVVPSMRWR